MIKKRVKKYSFDKIEKISGVEFKWGILSTALILAMNFGWFNPDDDSNIIFAGLAVFTWWMFRQYFSKVGDKESARWLLLIIFTYLIHGCANVVFDICFDLSFMMASQDSSYIVYEGFRVMYWLIIIASIAIIIGCVRILLISHQHSFPLRRIAISAAIGIPLYLIISSLSTIKFIWQLKDVVDNLPELGPTDTAVPPWLDMKRDRLIVTDMFGDLWSFITFPIRIAYAFLISLPYLFLLYHFFRADQANKKKEEWI